VTLSVALAPGWTCWSTGWVRIDGSVQGATVTRLLTALSSHSFLARTQ
jgi:hypothetical protein